MSTVTVQYIFLIIIGKNIVRQLVRHHDTNKNTRHDQKNLSYRLGNQIKLTQAQKKILVVYIIFVENTHRYASNREPKKMLRTITIK